MKRSTLSVVIGLIQYGTFSIETSLMAPFFPTKGYEKGLSKLVVGLVSAAFPLANMIGVPVLLTFVRPTDIYFMFFAGPIVSAISFMCFGILEYGPDGTSFGIMAFTCMFTAGFGAAINFSSLYVVLTLAKKKWERQIGPLLEASYGTGVVIGPPLGSLLYGVGGYTLPFVTSGIFQLFIAILAKLVIEEKTVRDDGTSPSIMFYLTYLSKPYIIYVMICIMLSSSMFGAIDTTLGPHLKESFGLSEKVIGFAFLGFGITYALAGVIFGILVDKGQGGRVFVVCSFLLPLSLLLLYFSSVFTPLNLVSINVIALGLIGIYVAGAFVPGYILLETFSLQYEMGDPNAAKMFAGFAICLSYGFGGLFGPIIIGGFAFESFGFSNAMLAEVFSLLFGCIFVLLMIMSKGLLRPFYHYEEENLPIKKNVLN